MSPLTHIAVWSLPLLSLAVTAAWLRQKRTGNAGIIDVLWTVSIGVLAIAYAAAGDGWWARRLLVGGLAGAWSLRLGWHLWQRVSSESEDGRYAILRERWGDRFENFMLWFFQGQAVLAWLLGLTFLVLAGSSHEGWRVVDLVAVVLWAVSVGGESLADAQLRRFRADPNNKGKTCRAGLWKWSRHPNYFFEWIHWTVYPVLGIGVPLGWSLWAVPALMLFLVLKVTGIPPTEEQSLRSRGEDYRRYQRETNAFFPGPPKSLSASTVQSS